jgi:hypothetical protein|tara:strand:+ start:232 stop:1077 length:846 start_codon:yes stop_codon:yes gene_type:complete
MKIINYYLLFSFTFLSVNAGLAQTEFSAKTGKEEPRYLSKFKKVKYTYPEDKSGAIKDIATKADEIIDVLNKTGDFSKKNPWFTQLKSENIYVSVMDLGAYRLTIEINDGDFKIHKGFNNKKPSMVLKLRTKNIKDLLEIVSDGEVNYEEKYRVFYTIADAAWRAMFYVDPYYLPGDKSEFKFDNLVHLHIPPKEDAMILGLPAYIKLTAVNVDGQWLVFRGLHGDPDIKLKLTLSQAADLYKLGYYEVKDVKSQKQAKELSKEFLKLFNETIEYQRKDHK